MSQKRRTVADEPFLIMRTLKVAARAGHRIVDHSHDWHQLVHISAGLMTVTTEAGTWVAPPRWAIWVPARIRHTIAFGTDSMMESLYLRPASFAVPDRCVALAVSPLLHMLIARAIELGMLDRRDPVENALATLIAAEFIRADVPPFTLPQPDSLPIRRAAALIAGQAPEARDIARLARAVGLSVRTLERRFDAETGMTIGRWRRQHALLRGLEALATGQPIKAAAARAGYATPSAFIAAFGKAFGTTPGRYFNPDASAELAEAPE